MSNRFALIFLLAPMLWGRSAPETCGTEPTTRAEELFLHQRAEQAPLRKAARAAGLPRWTRAPRADIGEIAIVEDADGVVARRNPFNLDERTLAFLPAEAGAAAYRLHVSAGSYDAPASAAATPVTGLGDDDTRPHPLPFVFPFFGRQYDRLFINSDGNLTFGEGDGATATRSLGRLTSGPPRIAPLFTDLDPSRRPDSVRVLAEAQRFVVSWDGVPEYSDFGLAPRHTFQIRLYPDGRIEMAYAGVPIREAVTGISPGGLGTPVSVLSFVEGSAETFRGAVAERFSASEALDMATAAQKFYQNHDDAYDYLMFFNALGLPTRPGSSAVALEVTVRNNRTGYGDPFVEIGQQYGSAHRLQAVINMGPVGQYPINPNGFVASRGTTRDTPVTIMAHEAGHLFLAFASVRDQVGGLPMLGFQSAHWAFTFNSEASVLEGNRIQDLGPGAFPRFLTVGVTEGFSPLDQYLMGLRAPEEVPPSFYVANAGPRFTNRLPQLDVAFDGQRVNVRVEEVIEAEGRRTPDHTVAQRRFRFAVILVVAAGTEPTAEVIQQVDGYRREFEAFYRRATSERAVADTSLRRALKLSAWPAAGVVAGSAAPMTLSVERPLEAPLAVALRMLSGNASAPATVTIPAGQSRVSFQVAGVRAGVDELAAEAADPRFGQAFARLQVIGNAAELRLATVSGDRQRPVPGQPLAQPVVFAVTDINALPYPGIRLQVALAGGGTVEPATPVTDAQGLASLRWTPGAEGPQTLTVSLPGGASARASTAAPRLFRSVVNAASFSPALAPGTIATLFGSGMVDGAPTAARTANWPVVLGEVRLLVNDTPAPLLYVSASQINFLVPPNTPVGTARLTLLLDGSPAIALPDVTIAAAAPGIFFDAVSGYGAILNAGATETTFDRPAARGGVIEIYTTGLGATRREGALAPTLATPEVTVAGAPARVLYSGLAPGYEGLYQVNAEVPAAAATGPQPLRISIGGAVSNIVTVGIR